MVESGCCGFPEVFPGEGPGPFTVGASCFGLRSGHGIDKSHEAYGRRWDLSVQDDQDLLAWLVLRLQPKCVHLSMPLKGNQSDVLMSFALELLAHQHHSGLLCSYESPVGSAVHRMKDVIDLCGPVNNAKRPWTHVEADACQYNLSSYQGVGAFNKKQVWTGNFDLGRMSLSCQKPNSLCGCSHKHPQSNHSSSLRRFSSESVACYFLSVRAALQSMPQRSRSPKTPLSARVERALLLKEVSNPVGLITNETAVSPDDVMSSVDHPHPSEAPDLSEAERVKLEDEIARLSKESIALWDTCANQGLFDEVKADLEVYRLSGETVTSDPRRTAEYRNKVLEGLGFGKDWKEKHPVLTEADVQACREVLSRKAAAF